MSEDLNKLEELFKNGFILQEEYDSRKHQITNKKSANNNANATSTPVLDDQQLANEIAMLPQLIATMNSEVSPATLDAVYRVRVLLSQTNAHIDAVIDNGGVPILVKLLKESNEDIQFQAAWALTNVAIGSNTTGALIEAGAVQQLISLVASGSPRIGEQAIWALGNISGDSAAHRDFVINLSALPVMVHAIEKSTELSFIKTGMWALGNLCRGKPEPPLFHLAPAIPLFARTLSHEDDEVVTDALWALSHICYGGTPERVTAVVSAGVVPKLMDFLSNPIKVTAALRILGNLLCGDDDVHTEMLLKLNLVSHILYLLAHAKTSIKKEACWMVSNITAGTQDQIQAVIVGNLIPLLFSLYKQEDWDMKKEIVWVIINALIKGNVQQVKYFVEQGCIGIMVDMLVPPPPGDNTADARLVQLLNAFQKLCKAGDQIASTEHIPNPAPRIIEQAGGVPKIHQYLTHDNEAVRTTASTIMGYFST